MKSLILYIDEKLHINQYEDEYKILEKELGDKFNIRQKKSGGFELIPNNVDKSNPKINDKIYSIYDGTLRYQVYGKYVIGDPKWKQAQIIKRDLSNIHEIINVLKNYLNKH